MDDWIDLPLGHLQKMELELRRELDARLDQLNLRSRDQKLIKAKEPELLLGDGHPTEVQANRAMGLSG